MGCGQRPCSLHFTPLPWPGRVLPGLRWGHWAAAAVSGLSDAAQGPGSVPVSATLGIGSRAIRKVLGAESVSLSAPPPGLCRKSTFCGNVHTYTDPLSRAASVGSLGLSGCSASQAVVRPWGQWLGPRGACKGQHWGCGLGRKGPPWGSVSIAAEASVAESAHLALSGDE